MYYSQLDFQLVLERFWNGFSIDNSFIYFQNICHIPLLVYGIYSANK